MKTRLRQKMLHHILDSNLQTHQFQLFLNEIGQSGFCKMMNVAVIKEMIWKSTIIYYRDYKKLRNDRFRVEASKTKEKS